MSSENVYLPSYILLVDDHDEVAMYLPSTNKLVSQQTNGQTKVIQDVVSPEVSKLNHAVMNKKQGDQMQFSLYKRLEKRKCIHPTPCQPIIPVDRLCYKMW